MKILQKLIGTSPSQRNPFKAGVKLEKEDQDVLDADRAIELDAYLDIKAILSFECYGEESVGAMLLQSKTGTRVVFGLDVTGIHSFALKDELESTWNAIVSATRTLPEGEPLGIRLSSFRSADERILQLADQIQQCENPRLDNLLMSELGNVNNLSNWGLRQPKKLEFFPTYQLREVEEATAQSDKAINLAISWIDSLYRMYQGETKKKRSKAELKRFLDAAYSQGFQNWTDIFTQTLGVDVKPKSAQDLWQFLWNRINKGTAPKCPHIIHFENDGSKINIRSERNGKRSLAYHLQDQATIEFDRQYVQIDRRNELSNSVERNCIGAIRFDDKVEGWEDGYAQMRFQWSLLMHDSVYDTEIFTQLIAENKTKNAKNAQRLYQQAMLEMQDASKKTRYSAKADDQIDEAKSLLRSINRGDCPCSVGSMILVHRKGVHDLERACQDIITKLNPHRVGRERDVAYRLWTQSFFCNLNSLMNVKGIGSLRPKYQAHEVPGFFPLFSTLKGDDDGVEFLARDGGTPYHLQLFKQGREVHFGIVAGHRSSKSNLATEIVTDASSRGIPATIMDYPTKDGRSSFYHYTKYVGGAYLDIGKESINILEIPDFRRLTPRQQAERFTDFQVFVNRQIIALLNPDPNDYELKQACDDIITEALREFYSDGIIQARYDAAISDGFGSAAWDETPTLFDFQEFCLPERLKLSRSQTDNPAIQQAFDFINRRLTAKLNSPIGRAIAYPSTIRTDSQLTVFALRSMEDEDSAVYSLAAFSLATRRSLEFPESLVLIDEAQQLARYESICDLVRPLVTTGGKSGIRCGFITNDFSALAQSKAGSTILSNLNIKLIGKLEVSEARKIGETFEIDEDTIRQTHTAKFKRNVKRLSSAWIIIEGDKTTFVWRYAAPHGLSLAASNMWEADVRQRYFDHYGPEQGLIEFSKVHIQALKTGKTLELPDFTSQEKVLQHA